MSAYKSKQGRATVSGEDLTINFSTVTIDRKDTCSSSKDYTKKLPAETKNYTWSIIRD